MAAILKHWREASTLIILAPATSRLQQQPFSEPQASQQNLHRMQQSDCNNNFIKYVNGQNGQDYETLLLKRSSKSNFMPNLYVFPGGTSEDNDFSSDWISVFEKLGKDFQESIFEKVSRGSSKAAPMFTRTRDPEFSKIPPEVAFRIGAIRETFEESGILIVKKMDEMKGQKDTQLSLQWNQSSCMLSVDDSSNLEEWRRRVNENPDNFLKMCNEMELIPDILSLYEWTDWLTPTAMGGRRYDTIFYICCLDHKPETKEDNKETVDHQWISPSSVLSSYSDGKVEMAPPQVYELSRMMHFNHAADLLQFSANREPERVERFFPVIAFTDEEILSLMPGDDLYPTTPDLYTPKKVIQYDKTLEELDKGVKNFHRVVRKRQKGSPASLVFNIVFQNKHVGPAMNVQKLLGKL